MCRGAGRGSRGGGCSHTRYDTRRKPCLTTTSSFFPRYVPHRAASRVASPTPRPSSSPLTPARLSASVIAIAPSSTAGVLAKPPWKRPCAVRIAERMTTSLSGTVSSSCRRVCGCSPRREIHALHHDTLIDGRLVNGTSSRLFVTADDFLRQERGDLERRGARPEAGVVAELLGERVIDAWSSDYDHEAFAHALGLEQLDKLREVLDVDVLLRDDLAHQDGVGIALERRLEKLRAGDLRAHVERVHLGIALQAVVPGEALHVHDSVDADRVRVALDGRAAHAALAQRREERVEVVGGERADAFATASALGIALDVGEHAARECLEEPDLANLLELLGGLLQLVVGALLDHAAGLERDFVREVAAAFEHVLGVLDAQVAILQQRRVQGLGEHAEQHDLLAGEDAGEVEHAVDDVAVEDVARHVLGGRHVLERVAREELPDQLRIGDLVHDLVGFGRIDLEGVPEPDLPRLQIGAQREGLVDEVGADHREALLEGVGGGEVVVLPGVDDDAGTGVDQTREVLVDERALHVDVAEDDPVHGVVEHHVKALQRAHGSDLGHAETARVVAQADVAAELGADLVEGGAHEAEVLLGGVGAAEALGGLAVGHVVEQALRRGVDDGDDIGAARPGSLGLGGVLVDVAGGDDHVDVGLQGLADLCHELVAAPADGVDACDALAGELLGARLCGGAPLARYVGQGELAGGHALGGLLGALAGLHHAALRRPVSYTHLRAHETDSYLVCRLLL